MNNLEMNKYIDELASQYDEQSYRIIDGIIDKYCVNQSEEFYRGMLAGILMPLESVKGVHDALSPDQISFVSMIMRGIAHRIKTGL
ncbi:MAG: hypothetical protein IT288_09285 [Bdellovibrionales bacterium]|nr:hypothetical protein [Bdellovibrionales bacterium]